MDAVGDFTIWVQVSLGFTRMEDTFASIIIILLLSVYPSNVSAADGIPSMCTEVTLLLLLLLRTTYLILEAFDACRHVSIER